MKKAIALLALGLFLQCTNSKSDPLFGIGNPGFWLLGPYRLSVYYSEPGIDEHTAVDKKTDQHLVDLLNDAKRTIDIAVYNLGKRTIIDAIINAKERGIKVRMVGDVDEAATTGYRSIEFYGKIPFSLGNATAIQHNKFAVVDGAFVFMGTGNWTDSDMDKNNNNWYIIESTTLAAAYTKEFEQMFYGRYGAQKVPPVNPNHLHYVNLIPLELYYSPYDGGPAMDRIIELVDGAQTQIQYMIFAHTHDELSAAMIRAARRGVLVRGIHDSTFINGTSEEAPRLFSAGEGVATGPFNKEDGNENTTILGVSAHGGKMHCKTMIIDSSIVVTGSFNWSTNAVDLNDENMIVIHSPFVAAEVQQQWEGAWAIGHDMNGVLRHTSGDPANPGDVVMSEIMWAGSYDNSSPFSQYTNDDDWIELRNMTNHSIDLSHWSISWDYNSKVNYPIPDEFNWYQDSVHSRHYGLGRLVMPANGYFLLKGVNGMIASGEGDNKISGTKEFNLDSGSFKIRLYDLRMNLIDEAGNGDPPVAGKQDGINSRAFSMERFFYPTGHPLVGQALPGGSVGSWYTSNGNNCAASTTCLQATGIADSNFKFCDASGQKCTLGTPNYSGSSAPSPASNAFGGINGVQNVPIEGYSTSSNTAVIQMRWGMVQTPVVNCIAACGGACTSTALDPNDPSKIIIGTATQTPGATCTLTVTAGYLDVSNPNGTGFSIGGSISLEGHGQANAVMKIDQVHPAETSSEDKIVLRAQTTGTVHRLGIYYYDSFSPNPQLLYRMHDVPITAGQYIIAKLDRPNDLSEDLLIGSVPSYNMNTAGFAGATSTFPSGTSEATSYEVFSSKAGISSTDGIVFISYDLQGDPMDVMCYTNRDGDMSTGLMEGGMRQLFKWGPGVYDVGSYPVDTVNDADVQNHCSAFPTGSTYLKRSTDTNSASDFTAF